MDRFLEKISSYPLSHKVLFLMVVMLLIFGAFWMMVFIPSQERIESAQAQIVEFERQKVNYERQVEQRDVALAQIERLRADLKIAQSSLPETAEISSLLQRIHNQAKTAGLEILTFKRNAERTREYYVEIPVEMQLVGSYEELANFFFYVGRMTRIVNIKDVSINLRSRGSNDGQLMVSALATTFRYIPQ